MPRLIVSVAKTTWISPRSNNVSVRRLRTGRVPAGSTPAPAEDEVDGRKPPSRLQARDQGRRAHPPPDGPRTSLPILASPHANPGDASPGVHRLIQLSPGTPIDLDHLCLWTTEVVMEWDRTPLMHDDPDGPVDSADPLRDFVNVAHGGRERDELNLPRAIDNDLLPHRASSLVSHVVTFVQHHVGDILQGVGVQLVAEDLRGHHDKGDARVDLDISRQDSHELLAVLLAEIGKLLVAQGLEGGRVGDAPSCGQRLVDRELRDGGLPRPRR